MYDELNINNSASVYTHTYVDFVRVWIERHICGNVPGHTCIHIDMQRETCVCTDMYICTRTYICMYVYVCIRIPKPTLRLTIKLKPSSFAEACWAGGVASMAEVRFVVHTSLPSLGCGTMPCAGQNLKVINGIIGQIG